MQESDLEWAQKIKETHHTYYPICGKNIDDIVGVLNTKDYFRLENTSRKNVMEKAVSPALFVAETTPANMLFSKMKSTREYFAVVVDEYGGVSGIITLHDLIELIVGDLIEKDEQADYEIIPLEENKWQINGLAPIDEVEETLKIKIPKNENEYFETFSGYVSSLIDSLPEDGTTFEVSTDQMKIEVLNIEERCINKVVVTLLKEESKEEQEDKDKDKDKEK